MSQNEFDIFTHSILCCISVSADTVFFAAINQYEFSVSDETVIVWNTAVINPGGNYDTVTGAYTAFVHGYYHFTVQKQSNNKGAHFRIYKEGVEVLFNDCYIPDHNAPSSASSFILELQAGERVQIYNHRSSVIYGIASAGSSVYRSWFSGFLLHAL